MSNAIEICSVAMRWPGDRDARSVVITVRDPAGTRVQVKWWSPAPTSGCEPVYTAQFSHWFHGAVVVSLPILVVGDRLCGSFPLHGSPDAGGSEP